MKKPLSGIFASPAGHWVGDGFPVRSLFNYDRFGQHISPFLLLDYAGPRRFEPATTARGVGEHPHRGFETVTIVYQGEVSHRDSTGSGGTIGPGDVQWMTAAGGIVHEEFHSPDFMRRGGELEMVQLWVNLPARDKMSAPSYQTLRAQQIPTLPLADGAGSLRVIAGAYGTAAGPARTFSPLNVWDLRLAAGHSAPLQLPPGHIAAVAVLRGAVSLDGGSDTPAVSLALFGAAGDELHLRAREDSVVLVMTGVPIPEPIVGYGPFVMNSRAEIEAAVQDFQAGRFGRIAPQELRRAEPA
jgi:redox-sensitive bicupin YhaK (pirin superfamily)